MKLSVIIAASKLVGEESITKEDEANFQDTVNSVVNLAREDKTMSADTDFVEAVEHLISNKLFTILKNNIKINQYSYDPETTAALLSDIANGYRESPILQVAWLDNLANFHKNQGNWTAAALCKVQIVALQGVFIDPLSRSGPSLSPSLTETGGGQYKQQLLRLISEDTRIKLRRVCPNISIPSEELAADLAVALKESADEGQTTFTRAALEAEVKEAVDLLKNAKPPLYEAALEVGQIMASIQKKRKRYEKLTESFGMMHGLCENIMRRNAAVASEMMANYYRVCCYGLKFEELAGKEFVYRESPEVRLSDFTARLTAGYKAHFGSENIVVLPNSKPVNDSVRKDENKLYFKIVSVEAYVEDTDNILARISATKPEDHQAAARLRGRSSYAVARRSRTALGGGPTSIAAEPGAPGRRGLLATTVASSFPSAGRDPRAKGGRHEQEKQQQEEEEEKKKPEPASLLPQLQPKTEEQILFTQLYNLDTFIFSSPFTKSGKSHGDFADQYLRKTVLVTKESFPHIKKRVEVSHMFEVELSPIENAVELIRNRIRATQTELERDPPNIKMLQIVLQGSVLLQVNAGPLEICRVFLPKVAKEHRYKLKVREGNTTTRESNSSRDDAPTNSSSVPKSSATAPVSPSPPISYPPAISSATTADKETPQKSQEPSTAFSAASGDSPTNVPLSEIGRNSRSGSGANWSTPDQILAKLNLPPAGVAAIPVVADPKAPAPLPYPGAAANRLPMAAGKKGATEEKEDAPPPLLPRDTTEKRKDTTLTTTEANRSGDKEEEEEEKKNQHGGTAKDKGDKEEEEENSIPSYPPEQVAALKDAMRTFVQKSGDALRLNATIITQEMVGFQQAAEEGYADLVNQVRTFGIEINEEEKYQEPAASTPVGDRTTQETQKGKEPASQ